MANPQNLIPQAHVLTVEEARKGGKNSVKSRNYKKEQLENLKKLLDSKNNKGITYRELINLGLIKGALKGNAINFKTLIDCLDDNLQVSGTPNIEIKIVDNSNLEKAMYDNNDKV